MKMFVITNENFFIDGVSQKKPHRRSAAFHCPEVRIQIALMRVESFGIICCFLEMIFGSNPLCSSNFVSIMS